MRTEDWRPPSLSLAAGQAAAATLHTTTPASAPSTTSHTDFKLIASDSKLTGAVGHLLITLDNVES